MKRSMDLGSAVFAAIDAIQQPGREADGEGQQNTECGQPPQDKEPNLPKGSPPSHRRHARRELSTAHSEANGWGDGCEWS